MSDREADRLDNEGLEDGIPPSRWDGLIDLGEDPERTWNRITGVVRKLIGSQPSDWPEDDYWRATLPEWLTSFMFTREECLAVTAQTPRDQWDDLPWEFGSWLEAIRDRDWRWWGYTRSGTEVRIVLEIVGIPPRIDALRQVILASGAKILSEEFI